MRYKKVYLVLLAFLSCSLAGYCDKPLPNSAFVSRLKLQDQESVVDRANRVPSFSASPESAILQDPFLNSEVNGLGAMMQTMSGNSNNIYMMQDIRRQQGEYAKQQLEGSAPTSPMKD